MGLGRHRRRDWANTLGGPLVVLEEGASSRWHGSDADGADYARACAVTGTIDVLDVDGSTALVLGDEPAMTCVAKLVDGVAFVRWHAADDEKRVDDAIDAIETGKGQVHEEQQELEIEWRGPWFVLFDSVEPGDEQTRFALPEGKTMADGALRFALDAGRYVVSVGRLDPSVGSLTVVRLRALTLDPPQPDHP